MFVQSCQISNEKAPCHVDSLAETIWIGRKMQAEQPGWFTQRQVTASSCAYQASEKLKRDWIVARQLKNVH